MQQLIAVEQSPWAPWRVMISVRLTYSEGTRTTLSAGKRVAFFAVNQTPVDSPTPRCVRHPQVSPDVEGAEPSYISQHLKCEVVEKSSAKWELYAVAISIAAGIDGPFEILWSTFVSPVEGQR